MRDFHGYGLRSCNILTKTNLALALFFYYAQVSKLQKKTIFTRTQTWDSFFMLMAFVSVISSSARRCCTIVLSFQLTGTILTRTQTQDNFSKYWPYCNFFLVSRHKHDKFGANQFIHSWVTSEHTYIHNLNVIYKITRGSSVWSLDIHTGGLRNSLLSCNNGLLWLLLCWLRSLDCMYW